MPFTLTDLHIFTELLEDRTLVEVGHSLHLGQPAISKALRAAELTAGFPLIEHVGRRVRLTAAGRQVAEQSRKALEAVEGLDQLADDIRKGRRGLLRLLAANTPGTYILPPLIERFLDRYPYVQVELNVTSASTDWARELQSRYDLGVGPRPIGADEWLLEPLYDDRLRFVVSPLSSLAAQDQVDWSDLTGQALIGPLNRPYWMAFVDHLASRGVRPSRLIPVHGLEAIKQLVEAGAGVGLLYEAAVIRELQEGRLAALDLADPELTHVFYLIQPRGAAGSPILDRFRMFLNEEVRSVLPPRTMVSAAPTV